MRWILLLTPFHIPGGGTTCDALYMGVPVVTLGDGSHGGNFGISLLKNIGLDFACSYSVEEYIQKALLLAQDRELLNALHLGLRNMMENSPIMNEKQYMQELEHGISVFGRSFHMEVVNMCDVLDRVESRGDGS